MKVLIACEFSGIVREAFRNLGHDAWSCDLIESTIPSKYHIVGNVLKILNKGWDLIIAFPPCTYLCVSGARWFKFRKKEQIEALKFVKRILNAKCKHIAIENPIGVISTKIRKPDQIVQPWMFGHGETKATCLWLKGLPKLKPTRIVKGREARIHHMPPSPERGMERSITYRGIGKAMAIQWSDYISSSLKTSRGKGN